MAKQQSKFQEAVEKLRSQKLFARFPEETEERVLRYWYIPAVKYIKGRTAPRVEKNIIDFIKLSGHQAEKRAVTGRQLRGKDVRTPLGVIKGKDTYIPSTGTKGSADISAVVYGVSIAIEVKLGKDRQSDHQKKYEQAINKAGGIYFIAHDEEDFLEKWTQLMEHPRIILMKEFEEQNQ